jgi:thiol:disulfide interchange protein DsbD
MTVKVPDSAAYSIVGAVSGPAPDRAMDPNFNIETETYSNSAAFRLTVSLPQGSDARAPFELKVRSQACSDKLCLPARTASVTVEPGKS